MQTLENNWASRFARTFFEFSLCLSRACLGKMFVFIYKRLKNAVFRSDEWFLQRQLNASSHTARQGYKGTRWGKMLGESNMHGLGKGPKALM
jgi:hypothetical protein